MVYQKHRELFNWVCVIAFIPLGVLSATGFLFVVQ